MVMHVSMGGSVRGRTGDGMSGNSMDVYGWAVTTEDEERAGRVQVLAADQEKKRSQDKAAYERRKARLAAMGRTVHGKKRSVSEYHKRFAKKGRGTAKSRS